MPVSTYPTLPPADRHPAQHWESLAALRECLIGLDPDIDLDSSTAHAALILLAGLRMEHNVVKLAKFTGLPVEFVARCARRLIDNGIWRCGETICSWRIGSGDLAPFWADVAVAEGKLCRRLDETGRAEWAPGGHWWKSFDLVRPSEAERLEQSVLYYSPPPAPVIPPEMVQPDDDDWQQEVTSDVTTAPSVSTTSGEREPTEATAPSGPSEEAPALPAADAEFRTESNPQPHPDVAKPANGNGGALPPPAAPVETHPGKRVPELFPGAVWL